jgi:hypothetical protein
VILSESVRGADFDMAHDLDPESNKRMKRESVGGGLPTGHSLMLNQHTSLSGPQGPSGTINYLLRPDAERLPLIAGDNDTFSELLDLMSEYEGM